METLYIMSNSNDKASTCNGGSSTADPMARLPSFKPPRDLALGPPKPNKKIFTPNLNVIRNKNKGPSNSRPPNSKKDERGKRPHHRFDRSKITKDNISNIIKSAGIFSDAFLPSTKHRGSSYHGSSGEAAPAMEKPLIRVRDFKKTDKDIEEQRIKVTMSKGLPDMSRQEEFKQSELDAPVKLPMDFTGGSNVNRPGKPRVQVRREFHIKKEKVDSDEDNNRMDVKLKSLVIKKEDGDEDMKPVTIKKEVFSVKQDVYEDNDLLELLRSNGPTLILVKMPETLPGCGGYVDDEPSRSKTDEEEYDKPKKCYLKHLEEGKIGKMRVHRSGKVTFALGTTDLDVRLGTKPPFLQQVTSVAADEPSRSAAITNLGPFKHKLVVVPEWEEMLPYLY